MAPSRDDYAKEITSRFAANLVGLRQEAGLSQEELAFRASIHRTQISLMESGKRLPRFETLVKLVGALGTTPAALMRGIAWEPNVSQAGGFRVAPGDESQNA
jgi:transcriptional regulator with XRE-family HTH domain